VVLRRPTPLPACRGYAEGTEGRRYAPS